MPTEMYIVTEMGLPLFVEIHEQHVMSLKGSVTVNCGAASLELDLKKKYMTHHYGHVTTICPFTNELVMAGLDKHISANTPVKTVAKIEPITGKVVVRLLPATTPATTAVDLAHYHVR